jgi:hypothetical protein
MVSEGSPNSGRSKDKVGKGSKDVGGKSVILGYFWQSAPEVI